MAKNYIPIPQKYIDNNGCFDPINKALNGLNALNLDLLNVAPSPGIGDFDTIGSVSNAGITITDNLLLGSKSLTTTGPVTSGKLDPTRGFILQITSKTTGVTLDTPCGVINTVALSDAAAATFTFTLTSASITGNSVIFFSCNNTGNGIAYATQAGQAPGSCTIRLTNIGTAAFNSLVTINYIVFN